MIPLSGWLAARIGRRRYLLISIVLFIVSYALCGFAQGIGQLVFFRLIQGAAGAAMQGLRDRGLVEPLRAALAGGTPFLGVCLGMQLLFGAQEEDDEQGLGIVAGRVRRLIVTSTSEVYGTARYTPIDEQHPLQAQSPYAASKVAADKLADAAEALSWECVGALVAIQREVALDTYVETGERIDAEISAPLIRTLFSPRTPLHDGAVIVCSGRICAAGCQLPLGQPRQVVPLPASAINYAPYGDSVFIVTQMKDPKGNTYRGVRQQVVKVEGARGDQVAITSGINPGDEVVSSGVFRLRNGAPVQVNNSVKPDNNPTPKPEDS